MSLFESMERDEALQHADIVDLFGGPGGWEVALHLLGLTAVGLEHDRWACATRRAAGWPTVQCDVSHADPADYSTATGLIASPPCQAFSTTGKRAGLEHVAGLIAAIRRQDWAYRPARDPRIWLVLEVGRWVDVIRPRWIALEQVPAVLPLWKEYAEWLRTLGYNVWCGVLNAADYGVPQIRKRAVLIAHMDHPVGRPAATHSRDGDDGRARWVTMAEGLGWGLAARPGMTFAPGAGAGGGAAPVGGSGARESIQREIDAGRWAGDIRVGFGRRAVGNDDATEDGLRARDFRGGDEPAFVVTEKARSWVITGQFDNAPIDPAQGAGPTLTTRGDQWMIDTRRAWGQGRDGGNQMFDANDRPAATVTAKTGGQWVLNPGQTESQPNRRLYSMDEPAPTLTFGHDANAWVWDRPATTIAGDPRAFAPGSHIANDGSDNTKAIGRSENAIRLTIRDALLLQSFPADYPVRGSRSKQFEQVGNAISPGLAFAVLNELFRADRGGMTDS